MADASTPRELEDQAVACLDRGAWSEALVHLDAIIQQDAADEYIWGYAGDALCALKEYARSVTAYENALRDAPDSAELHVNIARPLYLLGEADAAATHLEQAVTELSRSEVLRNLAALAPGVPRYCLQDILEIRAAYGAALADPTTHPGEHYARRAAIAREVCGRAPASHSVQDTRPLKVAYLSAHFAQPGYMGPVWALINNHDREQFQVTLLADFEVEGPFEDYTPDESDTVIDVSKMEDDALRQCIADAGVDILVDLSAYSYTPRLSLFAERAAPIVVTWFNMYSTSGMPAIDYIIGDDQVVRPEEDRFHSEQVLRLPQSYLSFQPWHNRPPVAPAPGSRGNPFTFGSLVSLYKITDPVRDAWAEILRRCPESRLLLANSDLKAADNRAYLLSKFAERGIDSDRIIIKDPAPHHEFLKYYDAIDLALDAFPYSGGTTTMEAVWQGVPVVTQMGEGWAARTTASILMDTHLQEFCCRDISDYVEKAVHFATEAEQSRHLAELRLDMREKLATCTALDGHGLAHHMELLYRNMIQVP